MNTQQALGIDVGGTGIKGALVDTQSGELLSERIKYPTPEGGTPDDIFEVIEHILDDCGAAAAGLPLGVCVPAVVKHGRTLTAANISPEWVGLEAEKALEGRLGRDIVFLNDADAAGVAEAHYGEALGQRGLTILTTLGTGIGSALILDGVLIPNTELGHLELDGEIAEHRGSALARQRLGLDWAQWAAGLERYYLHLNRLFSPDLFLLGGGVSKEADQFLHLISLPVPLRTAALQNNAGILGAAFLAHSTRNSR
jgi:polyphosphate glucokinase